MEILENLKVPGGSLRVKIQKNDKLATLLMIHGFMDTKETFFRLEPFLKKQFDIISYDLRGHGDSSWNESGLYFYQEAMIDLQLVISKFAPEVFSLIGHSFGASLAARYAGIFPHRIRSLVCLEGFSGKLSMADERKKIASWLESLSMELFISGQSSKTMNSIEAATRIISSVYKRVPEELHQFMVNYLTRKNSNGYNWKYDPRLKNTFPIPFPPELSRELWEQIYCPVLILFGKQTDLKAGNIKEVLSHFHDVKYKEIEGAGHNLQLEQPEEILAEINKFYQKCASSIFI